MNTIRLILIVAAWVPAILVCVGSKMEMTQTKRQWIKLIGWIWMFVWLVVVFLLLCL